MLETLLLFTALTVGFFLPGWFLVRLFFPRQFTLLETSLYALAIGLTLTDGLFLFFDHFNIPLSFVVAATTLGLLNLLFGIILWYRQRSSIKAAQETRSPSTRYTLSSRAWTVLLIMLCITIGIRAYYLIPAGLPTTTDMGHHMYWSQYITEKESLPQYEKISLVYDPLSGLTTLTEPRPIADFIIGEHIPFALIAILTDLPFVGSFPMLVLFLLNILSTLALLALVLRVTHQLYPEKISEYIALTTFLFTGPLFALASPQAKFVSGGVVGNTFGNFFIPLILLSLYLALKERKPSLITLTITLLATLAYTHHLSTLILGMSVLGMVFLSLIATSDRLIPTIKDWAGTILTPSPLIALVLIALFGLFIALPSYLQKEAIDSAIGSPVKTTRTGLSFEQVSSSLGITRTAFALVGAALLIIGFRSFRTRDPLGWTLCFGWGAMLAIMAMHPEWVYLDIPSNRVGSYLIYPGSLLAGIGLGLLLSRLALDRTRTLSRLLPFLIIGVISSNGIFENGVVLLDRSKADEAQEVFAMTRYLSQVTTPDDTILKDHNYLPADAWMKLFFLRDYGYPLSRGLFSRYEETGSRKERCTLIMIASPNSTEGKNCFESTGTNYIVVNPTYDAIQFEKSSDFTKVYSSNHVAVFKRKE